MMSSRLRELGFTLPIYSIGGALAFLSVLVFRKRSGVPRWWAAAVFIPFLVWVTISDLADRGRSLANAFVEPAYLGASLSATELLRFLIPHSTELQARKRFGASIVVGVLIAVGFGLWFPILPE
jgi:hypothetical protein